MLGAKTAVSRIGKAQPSAHSPGVKALGPRKGREGIGL